MAEPLQPMTLEEDGQLFNVAAAPSYFVLRSSFLPLCAEDSSHAPVIKHFQLPGIFNSRRLGFASIGIHRG